MGGGGALAGSEGGSTAERAVTAAARPDRPRPQFHPGGVCIVPPLSAPSLRIPKAFCWGVVADTGGFIFLKFFAEISQKGFI